MFDKGMMKMLFIKFIVDPLLRSIPPPCTGPRLSVNLTHPEDELWHPRRILTKSPT